MQPVTDPSEVAVLLPYEHVSSLPSTVNLPVASNFEASATLSVPGKVWSTCAVVAVVRVTVTLSLTAPVQPETPVNDVDVVPV